MAKSLFTQWRLSPENFAANTTLYVAPAGGSVENESGIGGADRPLRQAGTAANLRVKIENNGVTAASTFTLMDSQVATSVVVAISASTNGDIEDTSNTAALVASDEITLRMATGSSGTSLDLALCSMAFDADTNMVTLLGCNSAGSSSYQANETEYFPVFGGRNSSTTEGDRQYRIGGANVTWQDMSLITGNVTRTDTSTVVSRVNAADGNMSISIIGSDDNVTLEDAANNDALSENDDIAWKVSTGGGTGTLNLEKIFGNLISTDGQFFTTPHGNRDRVNDNLTRYFPLCGDLGEEATESRVDTRAPFDFTGKELIANIIRMIGSVTVTYVLRINGSDGNQSVVLTGVSIGTDTSSTDSVSAGDDINFKYSSPVGGTNYDPQYCGMIGEVAGATTVTVTLSLDAAVQQQKTLAASLDAGIQVRQTRATSLDAAVASALSRMANLDVAIQALGTMGASLDAAVRIARTVALSLDAAVAVGQTATTALDAFISGAAATTITTSLDAAIQKARTVQANLDALLQATNQITTGLDAALVVNRLASLSLDAALAAIRMRTASLDAAVRGTLTRSASLDAAIQTGKTVSASLNAGVAIAEVISTGLSGVLEQTLTVQASLGATVLATLNRATSLDAFIEGASVPVTPAAGRTFTVAARPDCTILPDGRVYVIPKGGRVH